MFTRGYAPSYLTDMISRVGKGSQRLRSGAHGNCAVPPTRTVRMGPRSFAVSGPTLCNSLPVELKTMQIPLESFKSKLKTYLFTIYKVTQWCSGAVTRGNAVPALFSRRECDQSLFFSISGISEYNMLQITNSSNSYV